MKTDAVKLYNTLNRQLEEFKSIEPGKVRLYCCGPTVYDYAHIGNLRTYVFEDLLVKTLRYAGYDVNHVMNITDVGHLVGDGDAGEDKMEKGSAREGKTAWEIANFYTDVFFADLKRLNISEPNIKPKATDHIQEMIDIIVALEKKGFVYQTSDGLYFNTVKYPDYGKIGKINVDDLDAGNRVDMGEKKSATDFALWKFSPKGEKRQMEWESPWGIGFPGWHIECSAMAMKYLGESFDMHCGGKDHITVHHPNEIAQSECATDKKFANYWLHGAWLNEDSGKMSKSSGEFLRLDVLEKNGYSALDYRFLLLQAHYRVDISFSYDSLDAAKRGLAGIRNRISEWSLDSGAEPSAEALEQARSLQQNFSESLYNDLNSAQALAVLFDVLKDKIINDSQRKELVLDFDRVLGLGFESDIAKINASIEYPESVQKLIDARDAARKARDWSESDRLRDELKALGYQVVDTAAGTKLKS